MDWNGLVRLSRILFIFLPLFFCFAKSAIALGVPNYAANFGDRDGCFVLSELSTGRVIAQYNAKRCATRFSPCSSFKIAAALMAFESKVLADDRQLIKWDGVQHDRVELNQDQTPASWMKNSALWVTQWITPQLGMETIQNYLREFSYGNEDFSGGITTAWVSSTLKISADEQSQFLRKLWMSELPVSERTLNLTKKVIFIKRLGVHSELFGKTGSGCLDQDCDKKFPGGRMLGWFVGVLKDKDTLYVFAANASDTVPDLEHRAAGLRLRETVIEILNELGVVS